MALVAVNGENRRVKTALFLLCCAWVGLAPHWIEAERSLLPAIIFAFLLGSYGLRVVIRDLNSSNLELKMNSKSNLDDPNLPSVDVLVAARDEENVIERLVQRLAAIQYPKDKISISIIDDGSIDITYFLLEELTKDLSNFQVLRRERMSGGGKSGALNYALSKIDSEWLFILDADAQLQEDVLLRLAPCISQGKWSAVQLRKSVVNSRQNQLACFQAMEMAMDAAIQSGRLAGGGIVELRGNGQFLKRKVVDECGGFNEDTVTDDLDLSFRLLIAGASVAILWDPPVQEEAVANITALFRQRQRWAEGGLQRFFDYWNLLISNQINISKRRDLTCFFLLQYALPVISFFDIIFSIIFRSLPLYWPFSLVAFSVSGLAYWRGCRKRSEGPDIPKPKPWNLLLAIIYLGHWFIVIPWVSIKMAIFPKKLVWAKTSHAGV